MRDPLVFVEIQNDTNEGTFSTDQSLLSADSMYKVDPSKI